MTTHDPRPQDDLPRPWLASYPEGVPAEIPPPEFASLADFLRTRCAEHGAKPAFTCLGKSLSFADLDRHSDALAAWLQERGFEKGDRIAVMMPNTLQYPVAIAAILKIGGVVVNVNPLYTPPELRHQLTDSGAKGIIVLENFAHTVQEVASVTPLEHIVVSAMGDLMGLKGHIVNLVLRKVKKAVPAYDLPGHVRLKNILSDHAGKAPAAVPIAADDLAFLQYTGGTTGVAKGAALTHANILANLVQMKLWLDVKFRVAGRRPDPVVYMCALPLYHIFALTVNCMGGIDVGAHNILIPNPRDIPAFVKEWKAHPPHIFPALNTLFIAMMANEDFRRMDFSGLMITIGGGMAVQRAVAEQWQELTGCVITEGYGLSETSPVACVNPLDLDHFTGAIGVPVPSTDAAILDDDGNRLAIGETGEIAIRGPQVMAGYWQRPEETARVMTDDGFFRTGDIGVMDEKGYIRIVDRKKDMILVSGFNVYPNEVEAALVSHPGILEVAAIGVPDEHSGEVVKVFIVRADENLTEEDVLAHAKESLTGYKRPKYIEFRDELPKSNVGKILRRVLREEEEARATG